MKKAKTKTDTQLDFRKGVRGKYYAQAMAGMNVVVIDPDLFDLFPDSISVNAALRSLADVARRATKRPVARAVSASTKAKRASK